MHENERPAEVSVVGERLVYPIVLLGRDGTLVLDSGLVLAPDAEIAAFTERGEIRICIQSITENV